MGKRLSYEQKKEKFVVDAINKMFKISGHKVTYDDIKDRKDAWYQEYTMTEKQNDKWQEWGIKELQKKLNLTETYAKRQMAMVSLMWGLKFSDLDIYKEKHYETDSL
jgi:hypothetical protein